MDAKDGNVYNPMEIRYESLCSAEIENLSDACMSMIRKKKIRVSMWGTMKRLFLDVNLCCSPLEVNTPVNETLLSVMEYLFENAKKTRGMFFYCESDANSRRCVDFITTNENADYLRTEPDVTAIGFKNYVLENIRCVISVEILELLLHAYKENSKEAKERIIPRLPFVINPPYRLFLKSLGRLLSEVKKHSQKTGIDMNSVYDMFSLIIVEKQKHMSAVDKTTLRNIFIDIMDANFDHIPLSFFYPHE